LCAFYVAIIIMAIFTAQHAMQTLSSDKNYVRLSVTHVHCDRTVERSIQIHIPY